jgi:two-component system sensor histidine kinase BaeS
VRRRIVLTIVGSVVIALVLAGTGTLVLARFGAQRYTEAELRDQAESVAEALETDRQPAPGRAGNRRVLAAFRQALRPEGIALIALRPDGTVAGQPTDGIDLDADQLEALRAGETISGREGRRVYAGASFQRGDLLNAVILSDRVDIAPGGTVLWFLLPATAVVLLGSLVAIRLARALTEPLRRAEDASRRIAAGDLTARVPEPPDHVDDEVADLSRSINAMAGALERSRGLEQQFLLSVSHDLRTPLTSIQGFAEALSDGTIDDAPKAGSVILAEAERLHRLVRDLLELARLDAHRFSLEATAVDLNDLVEACVEGFGPEAAAAGVVIDVAADPSVVSADPDRLAQVVANLLDNALKFAAARVLVSVTVADGRVRVRVDDDGPGIDAADRPHVFERLYQTRRRPVRKESGSGLGLAIVRELVVAMGGTVGTDATDATDATDRGGARFWFELPSHNPNIPLTRS